VPGARFGRFPTWRLALGTAAAGGHRAALQQARPDAVDHLAAQSFAASWQESLPVILDINELEPDATLCADLCIVGSGAAGIAIAREFIGTNSSVVLLEGGGRVFEPSSQEPYQSQVVGLHHGSIHQGRARVLGGTTTLWAGQALPLFEIDFQEREWVSYSGWPIDRRALLPYYERAEEVVQIPHVTYDRQTWPDGSALPPAYDQRRVVPYFSQFTHTPNFASKYRAALQAASNITVLTHANVISLEAMADAQALREVRVCSFEKRRARVQARMFVLCCGGIETARLLLVSNSVEPNGIGNRHDVVGRFFQDHPGVSLLVRPRDARRFRQWYNSFRRDGIRYALKMAAGEELQRRHRILHVGAEIYYPWSPDDPVAAILTALRDRTRPSRWAHAAMSAARRPGRLTAAAYRYFVLRQPCSVDGTEPHLGLSSEQQPNPDSRVTLGRQRDSLGVPRTVLDWRLTGAETESIEVFLSAIAEEWRRLEIADLDRIGFELQGRERGEHGGFVDANHHIGTTRMGTDPRISVVDANCRVHGYDNLYIGSSAVFPTGGFSNPTLTILALCLRISDEIKARLPGVALVHAGAA
jgi:choline dehydrogenase-like flavoprotein